MVRVVRSQGVAMSGGISVAASPDQIDEARLIRRVAGGDRRAFETLYRLYHPRLARFLLNILRKPELVEEVINDTLVAVWRRPDSYNGSSKLSTWIFAIAFRKALKARSRLDEPVEDKDPDSRPSDEAGPEQQLGLRQAQQVLLEALKELSPDHRTVVDLTYFHEFGYREIAEIMDCPVDTVKTRMFHARRNLRNMLAGGLADWL
jgi:RNA polymerase sigma factor (sigma-70 family)